MGRSCKFLPESTTSQAHTFRPDNSVSKINRHILPPFYTLLSSTDTSTHPTLTSSLQNQITALVNASHVTGPFFLGPQISYVDIAFSPWIIRLSRVLKFYRGWPDPEVGSRWETWVEAVERDERVQRTLSDEEIYRDRYCPLADNDAGRAKGLDREMETGMGGRSLGAWN